MIKIIEILKRRWKKFKEELKGRKEIGVKEDMMIERELEIRRGGEGEIKREKENIERKRGEEDIEKIRIGILLLESDI